MMRSNREGLILLNLVPDVGSTRLRRLLDAFGDLDRVWAASVQELQQVEGIGPLIAQCLFAACRDERRLEQELTLAQRCGVRIVTLEDAAYPKALRNIPDPPLALYVRGTLSEAEDAPSEPRTAESPDVAVAIVGSRRASLYGIQSAERLGYELALRGVTVVSGLARGIDGAAHRGALKAGGRTIAVLGCGLSRIYPPEHESLAAQIVEQGALISEYPMRMAPLGRHFPRRNRLISGLTLGVVIVEASSRSGALITADCALEQGREVFAVPGPMTSVTSQGTHQLLKQGARLVTSVEDILEELRLTAQPAGGWQGGRARGGNTAVPAGRQVEAAPAQTASGGASPTDTERLHESERLQEPEQRVWACVSERPRLIDDIAAESGLAMPEASSALLQLELKRLIRQLPGKQFVRRPQCGPDSESRTGSVSHAAHGER